MYNKSCDVQVNTHHQCQASPPCRLAAMLAAIFVLAVLQGKRGGEVCGGKVCGLGEGSEMQYPATGSNSGVVLKLDAEPALPLRSQPTVSDGDTLVDPEVEQTGESSSARARYTRLGTR